MPLRRALLAAVVTVAASAYTAFAVPVEQATVTVTNTTDANSYTGVETATLSGVTATPAELLGSLTGTGAAGTSLTATGTVITGSDTIDGSVTALQSVTLGDVSGATPAEQSYHGNVLTNAGGTILVTHAGTFLVTGNLGAAGTGAATMTVEEAAELTVDGQIQLDGGTLSISGTGTSVTVDADGSETSALSSGTLGLSVGDGSSLSGGAVALDAAAVTINGTVTTTSFANNGNATTVDGAASALTATTGDLVLNGDNTMDNGATLTAAQGDIRISSSGLGADNSFGDASLSAAQGTIQISGDNSFEADTQTSVAAQSTSISGTNSVTGKLVATQGNLELSGVNTISAAVVAEQGTLTLSGSNILTGATLQAAEESIVLSTDNSLDPGAYTLISNSTVNSGKSVTIAGLTGKLATVTGDSTVTSNGTSDVVLGSGATVAAGIVLDNVQVENLTGATDIQATGGDIVLQHEVKLTNAVLSTVAAPGGTQPVIMFDTDSELELYEGGVLNAPIASQDTQSVINVLSGSMLSLSADATGYQGTIVAMDDAGAEVQLNGTGLHANAVTVLKDSNFSTTAASYAAGPVQIGSIDTTEDEGERAANAVLNRFLVNGSYTYDDNTRTGYRNIGSILSFDHAVAGTVTQGNSLALSPHTLLWEDVAIGADGSVTADVLHLSGTLDAAGARVFVTFNPDVAQRAADALQNESLLLDGTTTPIVNGTVLSGFNPDALYDVAEVENGTYQRLLTNHNVYVATVPGQGASLVFSDNYRIAGQTQNQRAVASVLQSLAGEVSHTEGTLAASDNQLDRLLDAFDYTRSSGAAVAGLQSASGVSNTIAQHAVLDATSHHLDTLRSRINAPTPCTMGKGGWEMPVRRNDVWMVYTGGYDSISSQAAMGKYSRTWNGLLLGMDRQLCCHATLGLAFGYENGIARTSETKFDTDTYFIDLYSAVRTGSYDHKLSVGVGIFDFDTRRGITVSAPGHDFAATAQGSMTAHSINVGYELSRDFVLESQNAVATPFFDVNYAYIDINNLREHGAGEASLNTQYDNLNLVQLGLGARYTMQFRALPQRERGTLTASASAVFELSDRSPDALNSFVGAEGLPFSVESSKRDCFYGQFGLNATIPLSEQLDLVAGGYGRVGAKRGSVTGNVGLHYEF